MEITKDKITEFFCIIDDFCQEYDKEIARMSICEPRTGWGQWAGVMDSNLILRVMTEAR